MIVISFTKAVREDVITETRIIENEYSGVNTFIALNSNAVDFSLNTADNCTSTNIYNGTNAVNITSEFNIIDCEAELTNIDYNNENVSVNYTEIRQESENYIPDNNKTFYSILGLVGLMFGGLLIYLAVVKINPN